MDQELVEEKYRNMYLSKIKETFMHIFCISKGLA